MAASDCAARRQLAKAWHRRADLTTISPTSVGRHG